MTTRLALLDSTMLRVHGGLFDEQKLERRDRRIKVNCDAFPPAHEVSFKIMRV